MVTQRAATGLARGREYVAARGIPPGQRAHGTLVGLSSRELNGAFARIVGCGKGRYRVRLDNGGGAPSDTPLGVKL